MKLAIFLVLAFGLLVARCARADHYRTGSLEQLMAIPNWELVRQDFDVVTGEDFGAPLLIHRYKTLGECDKAQRGRISLPRMAGKTRVIGQYICRLRGDDVI